MTRRNPLERKAKWGDEDEDGGCSGLLRIQITAIVLWFCKNLKKGFFRQIFSVIGAS